MINKILLPAAFTAFIFSACTNNKPKNVKADITRDTLNYTYEQVKENAADCGEKPNSNTCSSATISYPAFKGQAALNDTLSKRMLTLFDADPDKDFTTQAKNFIAAYEAWKKANKKKPKQPFKLNVSAKITRQDSSLITIEISGSSLSGNNHPVSLTKFINWNSKADNIIKLDDILRANYQKDLTAIAEKIFRKQENLKDTSSLARDYFFKESKFALNNNYLITPVGIRFLYNPYEIKPYAAGSTDLFIPYEKIKHLLKQGSVLTQYIQK